MPPPPLPIGSAAPKKRSPVLLVVILAGALLLAVSIIGILAAILIPTVGKVRETANRTLDASHLRQIVQASLIHAIEHDGRLPTRDDCDGDIRRLAVLLAPTGGLNDASVWLHHADARDADAALVALPEGGTAPLADLSRHTALAWDYVVGLDLNTSPTTPVAWTRGLRSDGRWSADSIYRGEGGHIAFLGGNVVFFTDLAQQPLHLPDGSVTSDILRTLPPGASVIGAGPGTLAGATSIP
ncbi:hypothetical protein ASA1KI_12290 [Opitutales bacterium ASA1]|uniref:hypothetical protein n=1 Tax=Congregicoccus parvus TaxID=3081749 RepID=UPI002B31F467|nr:hypothetical protein ASA1KI_12290 [Opitutales bacterium ASA1]